VEQAPPAPAAFTAEVVFRQYAPRIYSLARRMLSNEADVEDVTQDVLLQVVRKLGTFRGEAELTTWLHRVTVNAALVHRRKRAPQLAREVRAPLEEVEDQGRLPAARPPVAGPVRQALDREARALIEQAVARLPEMYRRPFVLADIDGLANAEVGEVLGLSLPAVKSRLHRARLLLREALGPHFADKVVSG
jgi:RNA polymerase sigma-70 factor (ECF subfamily)